MNIDDFPGSEEDVVDILAKAGYLKVENDKVEVSLDSSDTLNITLTNASSAVFSVFKAKSVASNTTVELLSQPLIIMESEVLKAQATTADRLHIIVSFLEVN